MDRNTTILGGQEIRWGRIVRSLSSFDEASLIILCTDSLVEAWARSEIGPIDTRLAIFRERRSKLSTWIAAQFFAFRHISRGAIVHLTGAGMLILPAAIIARFFERATLLTSLTTSRVLPFKEDAFPRKAYWMFWVALKLSHVVDALNPKIDVTTIIDPSKLFIAPCSFSDPQLYRSAARKDNRVIFAGHFGWQKGAELLMGIVREWPREGDCQLILCGSGPYESALRAKAGGRSNIEIRRPDALSEVFANAKVFLSLQQWDNYPSQSLLEAMLCQCCVVATNVGDTALLVQQPWGTCLPVDAPPRAYVDAAIEFLRMEEPAHQAAGAAARDLVVHEHSEARYLSYLSSLWRIADGRKASVPGT